jgi:hypothetical protein
MRQAKQFLQAKQLLKVVLINVVVFLTLLLVIEAGVRIYYAAANKVPPHGDLSVAREWKWVQSRLQDGKVNFDTRFEYDIDMGWKNAANINTTPQYQGSIRTNAIGMRNDENFSTAPTPGKPRLMIVGDSYSFGFGVSNEDTYAYQLAKVMPDWDVMNLAVSATGTDQHYLMYERVGEQFKPNIVLLGFYVLDYNRNTYSFRDYAKPMYVPNADGSLTLTNVPVLAPEQLIAQYRSGEKTIGGWHYSYLLASIKQVLTDRLKRDRGPNSLARRTLTGIMEKFSTRVRANGATPVWVVFPIDDILENEVSKYKEISDFSVSEAKRLGMPVLDLEPYYREYLKNNPDSPPLWRPANIGGHLSAEGNKVSAQAIHAFLAQQSLLTK